MPLTLLITAWWRRAWPVATLIVVLGVLLHASLFLGRGLVPADGILSWPPWESSFGDRPSNYLLIDQYTAFLPVKQFFSDEARQGRFPLWNPHLSSGMPSLASMQVAALYPINLVLSPIGPFTASGIAAFVKLLLAGLFTMMYLRRLGASQAAGLAVALVYALSGFMIVWLGHPHVNAAVLLPLLLYFVEGQLADPRRLRSSIGFACAYATMLLGGHPPTALHVTVIVALYLIARLAERGRQSRLRVGFSLLAGVICGAALAAPQLLPYFEYYRESSSPLATASLNRWASHLTPVTLAHFVLPFLSGAPHLGYEDLASRLELGAIDNFNERTGYVGVFTLFLALVALMRVRTRVVFIHLAIVMASLLIVYGVPPFPALLHALPVASGINNQRLLLFVDFSAAVLAGFGLDALLRADPSARPRRLALAFAAAMVVALALIWRAVGAGFFQVDDASRAFLVSHGWMLVAGVAMALIVTLKPLPVRAVGVLAIGWIAVDLLWFASGYNPAIPREKYYPPTDAIRALQGDPSRFRVLGLSRVLLPNTAAAYGLDDVRGQDFTTLKRYEELITGKAGDFFFFGSADRLPAAFPLLNVKYVLLPERLASTPKGFELAYDGEIATYRNTGVVDRALIVFDHEVVSDPVALLARVRSGTFDPSKTVLLETPPATVSAALDPAVLSASARIITYAPDRVVIEAKLPRPGFLLLLDNAYPGWRASVGGRELPIQRADYSFRAVALPAGTMTVAFDYRPSSFRAGVALSLVVAALLAIVGARERQKSRRLP